jgi:hypothetical protein
MCDNRSYKDLRDSVYGTLAFADWNSGITMLPDGSGTTCAEGAHADGILRPDYTRSTFNLTKEAILLFKTIVEFERLILWMLRLDSQDENIAREISLRREQCAELDIAAADSMASALASPQDQVQVVQGTIQIKADLGWRFCAGQSRGHSYSEIYNPSENPFSICSSSTKLGDWVMPINSSHSLVLRKSGIYYGLWGASLFYPIGSQTTQA